MSRGQGRVPALTTALGACAASPAPPPHPPQLQLPLFVLVVPPARMLTLWVSTQVHFLAAPQLPGCFLLGTLLYQHVLLLTVGPSPPSVSFPQTGFHCFVSCTGPSTQ